MPSAVCVLCVAAQLAACTGLYCGDTKTRRVPTARLDRLLNFQTGAGELQICC